MGDNKKTGNAIFDDLAKQMLIDFTQLKNGVKHNGERGSQLEETLKEFLRHYLPKKFGVGSGEIINPYDQVTRQCDIVIYNVLDSPLLLIREGFQLFPVESVLGVIEVKSSINKRSILEIINNIKSIKEVSAQARKFPFSCFFAFHSDLRGNNKNQKIADHFVNIYKDSYPSICFDLGCILDSGMFYGLEDRNGGIGYTATNTTSAQNLCSFLLNLLGVLDKQDNFYLYKYFDFELPEIAFTS